MNQWHYPILVIILSGLCACNKALESTPLTSSTSELTVNKQTVTVQKTPANDNDDPLVEVTPQPPLPKSQVELPFVEPLDVEGNIVVAGSSTVFPLTKAIYQRFVNDGYAGVMKIDALGTEEGFKLFCQERKSDIVNASRLIQPKEIETCAAIGRQPISFRVGTDALVIVVNSKNDFLSNLALKDLDKIFTAEKWSDVNSNYPEEAIKRYVPSLDSGTLDFFNEVVFNADIDPILNSADTHFSSDDKMSLKGVSQNKYAIAILDYAFYYKNSTALKGVSIDNIEANIITVEQNQYPLARPLFVYSDAKIIKDKPQIAAFINFYLTHVSEEISGVGYFPNSLEILDREKTKFLELIN